jgi:hypothetical protein
MDGTYFFWVGILWLTANLFLNLPDFQTTGKGDGKTDTPVQ